MVRLLYGTYLRLRLAKKIAPGAVRDLGVRPRYVAARRSAHRRQGDGALRDIVAVVVLLDNCDFPVAAAGLSRPPYLSFAIALTGTYAYPDLFYRGVIGDGDGVKIVVEIEFVGAISAANGVNTIVRGQLVAAVQRVVAEAAPQRIVACAAATLRKAKTPSAEAARSMTDTDLELNFGDVSLNIDLQSAMANLYAYSEDVLYKVYDISIIWAIKVC